MSLDLQIKQLRATMETSVERFREELRTIHVGRPDAHLVEHMLVDQYGQKMPLKSLASIAIQQPATIVITPWDTGSLIQIEAAIRESGRNLSPINDRSVIRITLPPLSEERRAELSKVVHGLAEQSKIALRNAREATWRAIQDQTKAGTLREDDRERGKKLLDELIGEMNSQLDTLAQGKEKEIMTV